MFKSVCINTSRIIFLGLFFPSLSYAADGVLEINDACAKAAEGCFPGDGGGYPVNITSATPGSSFILTSDLLPSGDGIVIERSRDSNSTKIKQVTIDLNGFSIADGSGEGVEDRGASIAVVIRNGVIRDMGGTAVLLNNNARVEQVQIYNNDGSGIAVGEGSLVINCVVSVNEVGIKAGRGSLVIGNVIFNNTDLGLELDSESTSGYKNNVLLDNLTPQVEGGINMGSNICGDALCPGDSNAPAAGN